MERLLQNRIPILPVYGDVDEVVPYEENGALLEDLTERDTESSR